MKKIFFSLFLCLILGKSAVAQSIIIRGDITDTDTMMVLLKSVNNCDTVFTNNGKFIFNRTLPQPEFFTIICIKNQQSIQAIKENNERKMRSLDDGSSRDLFLECGEATIHTSFSNLRTTNILLTTHLAQDKYIEFRKRFEPLVKVARTIIDSSYAPKRSEAEKKILNMLYSKVSQIENEVAEKFVQENATNSVGAYILFKYSRIDNHDHLDSLYHLFNSSLQNSPYLKNIKDKINALAVLKEGDPVPGFQAFTYSKDKISLPAMNGKYTVLDFWGSWCIPCISGFPKMKEYYEKYKTRIEFIGIACNDKIASLGEAIRKYNLNWPQIINPDGRNNLVVKYNIEAYPTKILVDESGRFIQSFVGETESFYQNLDALFNKQK